MQKVINKGFTLIELLVVIAIIGILASIVLVSLGNARSKGADAGIQGNLDSVRTQAEVFASNNGNSYIPTGGTAIGTSTTLATCIAAGTLFADPTIKQALTSAANSSTGGFACMANASAWAVAVELKSTPGSSWCVSSTGQAKTVPAINAAALAAGTGCL